VNRAAAASEEHVIQRGITHGFNARGAVLRLLSTLLFSGIVAGIVTSVGTRDLESYEHVFFSVDRGTAVESVHVLGQPIYTMAVAFGVRLPLQGSLGASPGAALARYVPAPVAYWLVLVFPIGAAVFLVRHALEPLSGRLVSWLAVVLLFCSVPLVSYTISGDWPEVAVTYCAVVAGVFAPHAVLALISSQQPMGNAARVLAYVPALCAVWGLIALVHPGCLHLAAGALVSGSALALVRTDHPMGRKIGVVALIAVAASGPVALLVPDLMREFTAAGGGDMMRYVDTNTGNLLAVNSFPFGYIGDRAPFTYLILALVSLTVAIRSNHRHLRRLAIGSALLSIMWGIGSVTVWPDKSFYAPSNVWTLRDAAIVCAVFSGASAAGALRRSHRTRYLAVGPAAVLLVVAALQGPAYAAAVAAVEVARDGDLPRWNQDFSTPEERIRRRGLPPTSAGERLALWPGVRTAMRRQRQASVDFPDAGYFLVTAWTKQRTMRRLLVTNDELFNQTTELPAAVLCDPDAVRFLQLRYLLMPPGVDCAPWTRIPGLLVDGRLHVGVASEGDKRVRALPAHVLGSQISDQPALSPGAAVLRTATPLSGTSVQIDAQGVLVEFTDVAAIRDQVLLLPIAYDSALRASSGRVHAVGGFAALAGVDQRRVTLGFVPDLPATLRGFALVSAQGMAVIGLLGLACRRPAVHTVPGSE
jgi:hypothetical protein